MASQKITVVKDTWTAISSAGQEGKVTIKSHADGGSLFIDHSDSGAGALSLDKAINSRMLIAVDGLYNIDLKPDNDSDIYYIYSDVAGFEVIADFRDAPATSGESEITDGDAATGGTSKATLIAAIVNTLLNEPLDDGEAGALAMDEFRGLFTAFTDRITRVARYINSYPDHLVRTDRQAFIDVSNVAAGTYREIINSYGRDCGTVTLIAAGGCTVSLWGTDNADADASSDTGWVQLDPTTFTDTTGGWSITGQEPFHRLMIKYVMSDSSNSLVVDVLLGG
jgi:hypothetical protein